MPERSRPRHAGPPPQPCPSTLAAAALARAAAAAIGTLQASSGPREACCLARARAPAAARRMHPAERRGPRRPSRGSCARCPRHRSAVGQPPTALAGERARAPRVRPLRPSSGRGSSRSARGHRTGQASGRGRGYRCAPIGGRPRETASCYPRNPQAEGMTLFLASHRLRAGSSSSPRTSSRRSAQPALAPRRRHLGLERPSGGTHDPGRHPDARPSGWCSGARRFRDRREDGDSPAARRASGGPRPGLLVRGVHPRAAVGAGARSRRPGEVLASGSESEYGHSQRRAGAGRKALSCH